MSIFPPDILEKLKNGSSDWLSGEDFGGDGITLQIVSVEPVTNRFGVEEDHYYVQNDILKIGETFCYTFKDLEGNERKFSTHSRPFEIALTSAEVETGNWLHIIRTGKLKDTRYTAEKVEAPVSHAKNDEELDPKSILF